jgi:hypothetical protein
MTIANPGAKTQKLPTLNRASGNDAETTTKIAIRPVFVDDGGRRKRVLIRTAYVAVIACIGYMLVVGISLTAGPTGPLAAFAGPLSGLSAPVVEPPPASQPEPQANITTASPSAPTTKPRATTAVRTPAPAVVVPPAPTTAPAAVTPTPTPSPTPTSRVRTPRSSERPPPPSSEDTPPSTTASAGNPAP